MDLQIQYEILQDKYNKITYRMNISEYKIIIDNITLV